MNKTYVGDGKVVLVAGGDKIYSDTAAKFCNSGRGLDKIIGSDYNKRIVKSVIEKGHEAAIEFDWFIFGVEGYSRVTEVQLVRKRLASYMIKSGRYKQKAGRDFDVVIPKNIEDVEVTHRGIKYDSDEILQIIEKWYEKGVEMGKKEEELRYLKPQATEFKALIGMNARALRDWFKVKACMRSQTEIRGMCRDILKLCKEAAPDLFEDAGPNCVRLGYCPENEMQHKDCNVITKDKAFKKLKG